MPAWPVDGMDVLAVRAAAERAVAAVRNGSGPHLLELRTYRFRAHSMYDPERYRAKDEVHEWAERDPVRTLSERLVREGALGEEALATMTAEVDAEVDDAVAFAEAGPGGRPHALRLRGLVGRRGRGDLREDDVKTTYREATREALRDALRRDERVFLMGEDVGRYGGCFAVSLGLLAEFGPDRVRDTPLSESAFVGAGIGAAMAGLRPIVEIMTVNFSLLALDQIMNNAATLRHMSGGQVGVPLVIRMTTGAGRQLGAQHSPRSTTRAACCGRRWRTPTPS
jgi:pyruvate dehydrogenase E1 component beta subunit/2-oxoisovalerate dehydrogenase E1 component